MPSPACPKQNFPCAKFTFPPSAACQWLLPHFTTQKALYRLVHVSLRDTLDSTSDANLASKQFQAEPAEWLTQGGRSSPSRVTASSSRRSSPTRSSTSGRRRRAAAGRWRRTDGGTYRWSDGAAGQLGHCGVVWKLLSGRAGGCLDFFKNEKCYFCKFYQANMIGGR